MEKLDCILLVDDDEAANRYNQLVIEDIEITHAIKIVSDGREALDYLTHKGDYKEPNEGIKKPNLILLDINMPGMNGFEFLTAYEELPEKLRTDDIVILMLSTSITNRDKSRANSYSSVKDFINKPLTEETLLKIMNKFF